MKVLMLNGIPRLNGSTALTFAEMRRVFGEEGAGCPAQKNA